MLNNRKIFFSLILLISIIFIISGCAINKAPVDPQDPYEHFNRKVFAFNMALDRAFFRPAAKAYDVVTPWPLKRGIYNIFGNVNDITAIVNEILQLNFPKAVSNFTRVFINTIVGVGGLFDVATRLGVEKNLSDFGLTLARWGSRNTPYLVLPFFGPSTIRDAAGMPINYFLLSPWNYIRSDALQWGAFGLYYLQLRAQMLIGDEALDQAFDPYIFVRDAYLQNREFLINKNATVE